MNTAQLAGILRALLTAAAGYLAGKGIDITGLASPEVSAAIITVGVAVWSVFAKKPVLNVPPMA
jgi:flagellar motor component MotA